MITLNNFLLPKECVGLLPPGVEVALFMDALSGLARITCTADEWCLCILMFVYHCIKKTSHPKFPYTSSGVCCIYQVLCQPRVIWCALSLCCRGVASGIVSSEEQHACHAR